MTPQALPADAETSHGRATAETVIDVRSLVVEFRKSRTLGDILAGRQPVTLRAVDDVSLDVRRGEIVGLVGESGSGKTTLGHATLGLNPITSGYASVDGFEVAELSKADLKRFHRSAQMVFQDPYGSLNPRLTVGQAIAEPLQVHKILPRAEIAGEVERLLDQVGLPAELAGRRPRALSGGQRQRVGLARALAMRPSILVLDEPVAALDVSIQAQILNLFKDLRDALNLSILFIAHELGVVRHMADRLAVMYLGRIVEIGNADEIFAAPRHPYTASLLKAVPKLEPVKRARQPALVGDLPSPYAIPSGCRFRTRCPLAQELCANQAPPLVEISASHHAECHFATSNSI